MYVNIEFYKKKTVGVAFATMFATAINIILNLIIIPMNIENGFIIAAYTTLVGYMVLFILHYFMVKRMELSFVFNTKYILGILGVTLIVSVVMNFLYTLTIIRYCIIAIYGLSVLFYAYINRNIILGILSNKTKK